LLRGRELTDDNGVAGNGNGNGNGNNSQRQCCPRILRSRGPHLKTTQQGACRKEGHMLSYSETVEATRPSTTTNSRAVAGGDYKGRRSLFFGLLSRGKGENRHPASRA